MKKANTLFLILLLGLGIWSCSSETSTETETKLAVTDSTETETKIDSIIVAFDTIPVETPLLDEVIKAKIPKISALYFAYKARLSVPDAIKEEADIKSILATRDSLIALMQYGPLENYYYSREMEENSEKQEALDKEFASLGVNVVYAEGMYTGLSEASILTKKIDEIASDAYKYYLAFMQAYSNSLGSEYTYADLEPEINMLKYGEMLYKEFADSEYIPMIKDKYQQAILVMTDIHKVGEDNFIVGAMNTDAYPNMTDGGYYKNFASKYPKSRFAPVLKAISGNFSHIENEPEKVYLVLVSWQPTISKASEKALEYIMAGKDAPHFIAVKTAEGVKYANVYRFFSDKAKAEASLPKAQAISNKAKIIAIDFASMEVLPDVKPVEEVAKPDSVKAEE